jgi:hypothetical protein
LRNSLSFAEHVGFRFCAQKQLRLGAGCTWLRLGAANQRQCLESVGAGTWFGAKNRALDQSADVLPMLALKVVQRRSVGERRVFDLSVPLTESFLANGVAVHNCVDGRLTSAWQWCSTVEQKPFYPAFLLAGFASFDGGFEQ